MLIQEWLTKFMRHFDGISQKLTWVRLSRLFVGLAAVRLKYIEDVGCTRLRASIVWDDNAELEPICQRRHSTHRARPKKNWIPHSSARGQEEELNQCCV